MSFTFVIDLIFKGLIIGIVLLIASSREKPDGGGSVVLLLRVDCIEFFLFTVVVAEFVGRKFVGIEERFRGFSGFVAGRNGHDEVLGFRVAPRGEVGEGPLLVAARVGGAGVGEEAVAQVGHLHRHLVEHRALLGVDADAVAGAAEKPLQVDQRDVRAAFEVGIDQRGVAVARPSAPRPAEAEDGGTLAPAEVAELAADWGWGSERGSFGVGGFSLQVAAGDGSGSGGGKDAAEGSGLDRVGF